MNGFALITKRLLVMEQCPLNNILIDVLQLQIVILIATIVLKPTNLNVQPALLSNICLQTTDVYATRIIKSTFVVFVAHQAKILTYPLDSATVPMELQQYKMEKLVHHQLLLDHVNANQSQALSHGEPSAILKPVAVVKELVQYIQLSVNGVKIEIAVD